MLKGYGLMEFINQFEVSKRTSVYAHNILNFMSILVLLVSSSIVRIKVEYTLKISMSLL